MDEIEPTSEILIPQTEQKAVEGFSEEQLDASLHKLVGMHTTVNKGKQSPNKSKKSERRTVFPSRIDCGEEIFGKIPLDDLAEFYMATLAHIPKFCACNTNGRWTRNGLGIGHILIQSFFAWLAARERRWKDGQRFARMRDREEDFRPSNPSPPRDKTLSTPVCILPKKPKKDSSARNKYANHMRNNVPPPMRIRFSYDDKLKILEQLIPIEFPAESGHSIWKLVFTVLEVKNGQYPTFVEKLIDAASKGKASFNALDYYLSQQNSILSVSSPRLIIQTVLLGPLRTTTVENFIQNRSPQFKEEAKLLLINAESWTKDEEAFKKAVLEFAHTATTNVPTYGQFCMNFGALMSELRRDPPINNTISESWAIRALRNSFGRTFRNARNFYSRHEVPWRIEQLNDFIHTILVQRPGLKSLVLKFCNEFNVQDCQFVQRWVKFNSSDRIKMPKGEKTGYYLEEKNFLSIPRSANVFVVDTEPKLRIMTDDLEKYIQAEQSPVLALDAEWNPYVNVTRANVLQLAFRDSIYILDMDTLSQTKCMVDLLDNIFLGGKLLKLGYQFGEDLYQLSLCVKGCIGLYRPEKLVCVGKLVAKLINESLRRRDFPLEEFLLPDSENEADVDNNEKMEEYDGAQMDESSGANEEAGPSSVHSPEEDIISDLAALNSESPDLDTGVDTPNETNETPSKGFRYSKISDESIKNWGLSTLCQRVLGKGLDKQEQCSVWDRRPLRDRQIRYASLDAYCLLLIYQRCQKWAEKLNDFGPNIDLSRFASAQGKIAMPLPLFWEPIS